MSNSDNELSNNQYITFNLGKEQYGIELNEGREILIPSEITRVPNTPDYVTGVINLRGRVITILDFKNLLSIEESKNNNEADKRIIITTIENITSGFIVDQMQGVLTLAAEDIETENNNEMNSEFIKGIYTKNDKLIPVIDLKRLIASRKEAM
ncbi:MAG: chemotaxis protein CheW [Bacillota bacterium]